MGWSRQRAGTVMAISRVGSASAQATTITIPTHQSGDLILIVANRNNAIPATVPSGWVTRTAGFSTGNSVMLGWKLAKSSSETSGTWTNASVLHCVVYRGSAGILCLPFSSSSSGTSTTINYAPVNNYTSGLLDNWYVATAFQVNSTNSLEAAPTGMANINVESSAGNWKSVIHDTNASQLSNWPTTNVTVVTSSTWRTGVFQIIEFDGPAFGSGGGFRPVNIRGGADQ